MPSAPRPAAGWKSRLASSWRSRLALYAAALWWGSLTAIGFIAVPLVFAHSATAAQAGLVTAKLFSGQAWTSVGCGVVLLMASRANDEPPMDWANGAMGFVLGGLLLALLGEFAVAPKIIARQDLALWHSVGSGLYLLQWLCAGVTLWKVSPAAAVLRPGSS